MCGCLSHTPYWGPGPQPRYGPDWKWNWRPFGSQDGAPPTEPHQPGQGKTIPSDICLLSSGSNDGIFDLHGTCYNFKTLHNKDIFSHIYLVKILLIGGLYH